MIDNAELIKQGAEAKVYLTPYLQRKAIIKERFPKTYRHPTLDKKLTSRRVIQLKKTKLTVKTDLNINNTQEARCLNRCQKAQIDTPTVYLVDVDRSLIYMEHIEGCSVREFLVTAEGQVPERQTALAGEIGRALGLMHNIDVVHGDLTTSNLLMREESGSVVLIDFGLSYVSQLIEDKAVDLYVLERAFISTHPNTEVMFAQIIEAYGKSCKASKQILKKLEDVRLRGRKLVEEENVEYEVTMEAGRGQYIEGNWSKPNATGAIAQGEDFQNNS
ncbi:TP53 regulating kinase [Gamsiella multidivaricata]|nr:TP53 regulating kinase [Gamsiella multidivaricata]